MKTVTLSVADRPDVTRRALSAFDGECQGQHISFASVELLWRVLTPKRWDVLAAITGQGSLPIHDLARRLGRDVKAVPGDVHALVDAGVIERNGDGSILFPYHAVHVDSCCGRPENLSVRRPAANDFDAFASAAATT